MNTSSDRRKRTKKWDQCEYSSSRASNLRSNLVMHAGRKSKKCNQCDFVSIHTGKLRTHLKTHTREKSYKCNNGSRWVFVVFDNCRLVFKPPGWFFFVSIRAERRRREVRRWEHLKMYPPDCILAPRSRQALPFGLVMMMMPMMKMLKMMAMMMMPMLMIKMIKMMAMMMMNMIVFLRMPLHQTPVAPFLDFVFHLPQKNSFNLKFHL